MTEPEARPGNRNSRRWWLPAMLAAIGCGWLLSGHSVQDALSILKNVREVRIGESEVVSSGLPLLAFVILGTGLMCLFVPKTFISLAAGGLFGSLEGALVLSITAVTSAMVNYAVGRWSFAARNDGQDPSASIDIDSKAKGILHRVALSAHGAGFGFHLMVRLSPIPTTVISYAMGAAAARLRPYCGAALVATIPQWLWVYCGASATDGTEMTIAKGVGIFCSVVAMVVMSVWIPKRMARELGRSGG